MKKLFILVLTFMAAFSATSKVSAEIEQPFEKWEVREDGYAYYKGSLGSNEFVTISTPTNADLYYSYPGKTWTKVPNFHQYYGGATSNYSKTIINKSGSMSNIYELFQPRLVNMSTVDYVKYDTYMTQTTNKVQFRFEVDVEKPEIFGPSQITTDNETLLSEETILQKYVVTDDKDSSPQLVIKTNHYAANYNNVGAYVVVLEASDASSNKTEKTISIIVTEIGSPLIEGPAEIIASMNVDLTDSEILAYFQAKSHENISINEKLVVSDKTSYISNVPGIYSITVSVTDNSVTFTKNVNIRVIDDVKPVINGPDRIEITQKELESDLFSQFSASDNHDPNVKLAIKESTYTHASKPGIYYFKLEASDASGNKTEKVITITWLDTIAPVIYGPQRIVKGHADAISVDTFLRLFKAIDNFDPTSKIVLNDDKYTGYGDIAGTYKVTVHSSDSSNNYSFKDFNVIVSKKINGYYLADDDILVSQNYRLTKDDMITYLDVAKNIKLQTGDKLDAVLNDYWSTSEVLGAEGKIYVTVVRTNGARFNFIINTKVVESNLFNIGSKAPSTPTIAAIIPLLIIIGVVLFSVIIYKRFRR